MTVRRARPEDAEILYALNEEFNGPGNAPVEHIARMVSGGARDEIAYIAMEGDIALGFGCAQTRLSLCYSEPTGEITELYVRGEFRRRGAARALVHALLRELNERGAKEITLLTGEDNAPARALYESAGFRRTGEAHYEMRLRPEPETGGARAAGNPPTGEL